MYTSNTSTTLTLAGCTHFSCTQLPPMATISGLPGGAMLFVVTTSLSSPNSDQPTSLRARTRKRYCEPELRCGTSAVLWMHEDICSHGPKSVLAQMSYRSTMAPLGFDAAHVRKMLSPEHSDRSELGRPGAEGLSLTVSKTLLTMASDHGCHPVLRSMARTRIWYFMPGSNPDSVYFTASLFSFSSSAFWRFSSESIDWSSDASTLSAMPSTSACGRKSSSATRYVVSLRVIAASR
mmetsp:Transcript_9210/g.26916  ORF Transcript_9210/g.26916 Transcript_9210/m.26916 type:complete len:236 (-) Transcript_9210:2273-2980(-)